MSVAQVRRRGGRRLPRLRGQSVFVTARRWGAVLGVLFVLSPGRGTAEVPVLGRWQEFAYPAQAVEAEAGAAYRHRLAVLRRQGQLDDDPGLLARARRIGAGLIRAAIDLKADAAAWEWEIHTTSSAEELASCTAGGKLLLGSAYIRGLNLADGELATLIAHEVAHAIAEHQREMLSQVFSLNDAVLPISIHTAMERYDTSWSVQIRLAKLSRIQESEADQLGMTIAYAAGWPTESMVSFYHKLVTPDAASVLSWGYPPPSSRLAMATTFARWFPRQARVNTGQRRPAG
jgi:predicted Zn-dependent protease